METRKFKWASELGKPAPGDTVPVVLFVVLHRLGRGHRWKRIGTAGTRAEAMDLCRGSGDFRIVEERADAGAVAPACASATNAAPDGETPR